MHVGEREYIRLSRAAGVIPVVATVLQGANEVTRGCGLLEGGACIVGYNDEYLRVVYPLIFALSPSRIRKPLCRKWIWPLHRCCWTWSRSLLNNKSKLSKQLLISRQSRLEERLIFFFFFFELIERWIIWVVEKKKSRVQAQVGSLFQLNFTSKSFRSTSHFNIDK